MLNDALSFLKKQLVLFFDFRKISSKILLTIITISIALPIIISIVLITYSEQTINTYVNDRNTNTVRLAKRIIQFYIEKPLGIAETLARSNNVIELNPLLMTKLFLNTQQDNRIFKEIATIRIDHQQIYSTVGFQAEADSLTYYIIEEYKRSPTNKSKLSEFYIDQSDQPSLNIYHAIEQFGQVIAVLKCKIDLRFIWDIIDDIKLDGRYGTAFLVTDDNRAIAHPNKDLILKNTPLVTFINKTLSIGSTPYQDENNETIIGTYAKIDRLDWWLIIEQKQEEAGQFANSMNKSMVIFIAFSSLLALIIGLFIFRRISRPINELISGVKQYSDGNLKHKIILNSNDELEDLAEEFNSMSSTLLLNQRKLQRIERITAMNKFVRMVSHEIRNPLNSMNINMQILKREMNRENGDSDKKDKYLDILSSEIKRMDDLISNYLKIAQKPKLDFKAHNLHDILDEIVLMYSALAEKTNTSIITVYCEETCSAQVDTNQLKQVFINIVLNALDAMPQGGVLEISTSVLDSNSIEISFKDNGSGIPVDKLDDIFEFDFTSKKTGSGIGLALSKQIIEGHYGRIYAENSPSGGAIFYIELPIKQELKLNK